MATLIAINGKTKAVIRKQGYPTLCKTFIKKTDALSWARKTESEMERGLYVDQSKSKHIMCRGMKERPIEEMQADRFAESLLMPANLVIEEIDRKVASGQPVTPNLKK